MNKIFLLCSLSIISFANADELQTKDTWQLQTSLYTKHYHDDSHSENILDNYSYLNEQFNSSNLATFDNNYPRPNKQKKSYDDLYADDWGHDIYLYNVDIESNNNASNMNTSRYIWNDQNNIKFGKLDFDLDRNCRKFQKVQINGSNPNIDLILYGV